MFTDLLIQAGLSEKEALVYEKLLNIGMANVAQLTAETKLKRTTVYDILETLSDKKLVQQEKKNGKTLFWAEHPQKLFDYLEMRVEKMKSVKESLDELLPQLSSQYNLHLFKPVVTYYEGIDGLRRVFEDVYAKKQNENVVWGCVDIEKTNEVFPQYIQKQLIPKRIKNQLEARSLVAKSSQTQEMQKEDEKQIRRTVLLDKKKYPLPGEIEVYDDKIAMLSFNKEKFVGIVIQDKDLAISLKSIFQYLIDHEKK